MLFKSAESRAKPGVTLDKVRAKLDTIQDDESVGLAAQIGKQVEEALEEICAEMDKVKQSVGYKE